MADIAIRGLSKHYGGMAAVEDLHLAIPEGALLSLLGPSGCGKTTTLRMVAGFIEPTRGSIDIGGTEVVRVPPHRRDLGLVFQSYALFPHMTAAENIGFGLRMRRVPKPEIGERVTRTLNMVRLGGLGDRYPRQLSGGQQQRVALARALVIEPRALLLDEPLSNLDANLREEVRVEIREVQKSLGVTTLFVTHDQSEALSVSDYVGVMRAGRLEQLGTATDIYQKPRTGFVATFLGGANVIKLDALAAVVPAAVVEALRGQGNAIGVRPETLAIRSGLDVEFDARIEASDFLGAYWELLLGTPIGPLKIRTNQPQPVGSSVRAGWMNNDAVSLEA
ncbi:ABC transporter ATP-binding protein [Chelatococcus asaccharovorans]|uniref:Putative spermidine/putrescine transport system ATP-binding protein n=1 Tax=Chelatococcus asaccharovorans TaxID=28210 RepID=A0A2V3U4M2_9HYPH|nr:ABC transporter ATP-binding protein [Chelatococcus asaccharovorans]MBS7703711.1 ABC transporter ATP-binding protein [Chelatococcus asaccharovorans]PXW57869.1 putative spermidine/putrescine transport system ATP-binding protein [Chelatococcus asaccharovorans]